MKIKISKIDMGKFTVREDLDKEQLKMLKDSLEEDGQWNPIMVKQTDNGRYELIAGHYRFEAAKNLGWNEIEATVKDVTDEEAEVLSLKTNITRKQMSDMEEGKILQRLIQKYDFSQRKLAEKLGKSRTWIRDRLNLALNVSDYVAGLLTDEKLTTDQVARIATITSYDEQDEFAKYLLEHNISAGTPTKKALKRFKNKTIYTIGYQGKTSEEFIEILKNNNISHVVDIRHSAKSERKPEFSKKILEKELKENGIKYSHISQLGVPFLIQTPYIEGNLKLECVEQWYRWYIRSHSDFDFDEFVDDIKDKGRTTLMCMEAYAKPIRNQGHGCHRDILADIILETEKDDEVLFKERVDL